MNVTQILKALGILAIIGSGISFLLEGWGNLTGILKFAVYFLFITVLYASSEFSSLSSFKNIFASLFLGLAPTIYAQLGSFILDQSEKIPAHAMSFSPLRLEEGSPVILITVTSILLLVPMTVRAVKILQSSLVLADVSYLVVSGLVFLLPMRSSGYHAIVVLVLISLFYLLNRKVTLLQLSEKGMMVRLSGLLFFIGRASLYETTEVFYSAICFVFSLLLLKFTSDRDKDYSKIFYITGYVFLVAAVRFLLSGFDIKDLNLNYLLTIGSIIFMIVSVRTAPGIGIGFASFLAWWELIMAFILPSRDFIPGLPSLLIPLILILVSLREKLKVGFLNGAGLFTLTLIWHLIALIRFPETNIWIFLALCGLILLGLGTLIEKYKTAIGASFDKIMEDLK